MFMQDIVINQIKAAFQYNPETGSITRLANIVRTNGRPTHHRTGQIVGSKHCSGYRHTRFTSSLGKIHLLEHRLAFLLMGKDIPLNVDHINGNRSDNRWINLRPSNNSENQLNRHVKVGKDKDLPIGIYRCTRKGRDGIWYAIKLQIQGKIRSTFSRNLDDALAKMIEWRAEYVKFQENAL